MFEINCSVQFLDIMMGDIGRGEVVLSISDNDTMDDQDVCHLVDSVIHGRPLCYLMGIKDVIFSEFPMVDTLRISSDKNYCRYLIINGARELYYLYKIFCGEYELFYNIDTRDVSKVSSGTSLSGKSLLNKFLFYDEIRVVQGGQYEDGFLNRLSRVGNYPFPMYYVDSKFIHNIDDLKYICNRNRI